MTTLSDAIEAIEEAMTGYLTPMVSGGDIEEIIFGVETRKAPLYDNVQIVYQKATCDNTAVGTGLTEHWKQPIKVGATVKELDEPNDGFKRARMLVADARALLLANRNWGIPNIVRDVYSTDIETVPYPFGKKSTLYGAGTTLTVYFVIDNIKTS